MSDRFDADPLPVPFLKLAEIYRVTPQALRKAGRKLQLRAEFLENPEAIRSWMTIDGCNRGKLRKIVFDQAECARIHAAVEAIRHPQTNAS